MSKYWQIFKQVTVISFSTMLIYRSNVVFFFIFESLFLLANLVGLSMGVSFAGGSLAGWNLDQVMFVAMLHQVGHQIFMTFFLSGLFHIGFFVWSGRMDYVLLKPLHPLIGLHSATDFVISNIPNLLINCGIFLYFAFKLSSTGIDFSFINACWLVIFSIAGMAARYGLALLVLTPAFFAEKLSDGEDAFWGLQSLAKYPSGVFPRFLQTVFTFVLPIATIAAIPAGVFFSRISFPIAFLYLGVAVTFFFLNLKFFEWSVGRYQSVNTGA